MEDVLSIDEIRRQCPDEWVLIGDPELDAQQKVTGGQLLFHSADREEVYAAGCQLRPAHSAVIYTGERDEATITRLLV